MPSCSWRQVEVAACSDGTTRLLVGGRRVERDEFDRALAAVKATADCAPLIRAIRAAGSMTTRELADAEGIADQAASMRLKKAYALGLLRRHREPHNAYRYSVALGQRQEGA